MSLADPDDDLVSAVSLHRARPPVLHGYIAPFLLAYLAWLYTWLVHIGYEEWLEAGYVVGAAIVLLNVLVVLSCHWSVTVMAVMTCNTVQAKDAVLAEWAKVIGGQWWCPGLIIAHCFRWCPVKTTVSPRWSE